jgi:hypothetical protein
VSDMTFNEWLDLQPIDPALAGVAREAVASWECDGGETPLEEWAAYAAVTAPSSPCNGLDISGLIGGAQ